MKTFSYIFIDNNSLREFVEKKRINKENNLLVQIIYMGICIEAVYKIRSTLSEILPKAKIVGTTSTGAIVESTVDIGEIAFVFSVFENTEIDIYSFKNTDGEIIASKLIELIDVKRTKVIILYSSNITTNKAMILKSLRDANSNIIVTGMIVSSNCRDQFVFTNDCITKEGVVAICLKGEQLEAWVDYNCGWQPIGNVMTITEAVNDELISVNNIKIKDLYAKYFGVKILNKLIWGSSKYPFKITKDSVKYVLGSVKENEESIELVSEINIGEKVRFSIPNKATIYRIIKVIIDKYVNKNIETCFLFYSNVRKRNLENVIEKELKGYNLISQCFGIFSDGEYYHSKSEEQSYLYSNTCTLLLLTESLNKEIKLNNTDKCLDDFIDELIPDDTDDFIHFIEKFSDDLEIVEDEFEKNKEVLMHKERLATVGQMMGGVAHNLNTPICGISGQISILRKKITNFSEKNLVKFEDESKDEINDFLKLINNIDKYTKYMSNIMDTLRKQIKSYENIEIDSFIINELFNRTRSLISFELKRNKIEICCKVQEELCNYKITGELTTLIQVLVNLINNSIDSYGGNSGQIELGAYIDYRYPGIEPYVKLYVKDNGCGIDENIKSKLLYQMITTKGNKGTGIGIYLSHMMIKAKFKGYIDYKTESGKGTTMNIYIPYNTQKEEN